VIPSLLVYTGFGLVPLALAGLLPWMAAWVGSLVALCSLGWPAPSPETSGGATRLDELLPEFHFGEIHSTSIEASRQRVWRAIREVTARDIRFFLLLTWIRSPRWPGRGDESILRPSHRDPILEVALRSGFVLLAEDEGREVVFGAVLEGGRFRAGLTPEVFRGFSGKGAAVTAMNFRLVEDPSGALRLTTETRVLTTDSRTRRLFAAYWRLILPGSALIRRTWLAAIRRRAEGPA
jgi:hypothetical protein